MTKLKEMKTKSSVTKRVSTETQSQKPIPAGANILSREVRTDTEQIENGWLTTKRIETRWTPKGSEQTYGEYHTEEKKWYSKEDPLEIEMNDKALSDAFDDEDDD